jgi:hypothetical protein
MKRLLVDDPRGRPHSGMMTLATSSPRSLRARHAHTIAQVLRETRSNRVEPAQRLDLWRTLYGLRKHGLE